MIVIIVIAIMIFNYRYRVIVYQNPATPEGETLYRWFVANPDAQQQLASMAGGIGGAGGLDTRNAAEVLEKRKTLSAVKDENLGVNEKGDYFSAKACVSFIRREQDPYYTV